jgi:hypothetical protein
MPTGLEEWLRGFQAGLEQHAKRSEITGARARTMSEGRAVLRD